MSEMLIFEKLGNVLEEFGYKIDKIDYSRDLKALHITATDNKNSKQNT